MSEKQTQDAPEGHPEAYKALDNAWYVAIDRLVDQLVSDNPDACLRAAEILLEHSKSFTIMGAPYIPTTAEPRVGLLDDEEEDEDE